MTKTVKNYGMVILDKKETQRGVHIFKRCVSLEGLENSEEGSEFRILRDSEGKRETISRIGGRKLKLRSQ